MRHSRDEVIAVVEAAFPGRPRAQIMELLDPYGVEPCEQERERVQLAILKLSRGDDNRLLQYVDAAITDYRDVLWWVEIPHQPHAAEPDAADMLLFEWAGARSGAGPVLRCAITRQFSVAAPEDPEPGISQVLLSFHLPAEAQAEAPASGECWCDSPGQLAEFEATVTRSGVYRAVGAERPLQVILEYDEA